MLHITFTDSGAGILRQALRQSLGETVRGDRVIALSDDLSFGPVNPPDPAVRFDWMLRHLNVRPAEWEWLPDFVEKFWAEALSRADDRTVWYSRRSAREYAGFLEWVTRAGDLPYPVVDLSDVDVDSPIRPRRKLVSLALVAPERLDMQALFALGRPLDDSELQGRLQEWRALRAENASLRVLNDGKLISAEDSHFDRLILSQAQTRWLKVARVIGHAMAESSDGTIMQADDLYLGGRVAALVDAGMLEAQGNVLDWRQSEVRLPANTPRRSLPDT